MHQILASIPEPTKRRVVSALRSGLRVRELHRSRRFPGLSERTLREIADEAGVERARNPKALGRSPLGKGENR